MQLRRSPTLPRLTRCISRPDITAVCVISGFPDTKTPDETAELVLTNIWSFSRSFHSQFLFEICQPVYASLFSGRSPSSCQTSPFHKVSTYPNPSLNFQACCRSHLNHRSKKGRRSIFSKYLHPFPSCPPTHSRRMRPSPDKSATASDAKNPWRTELTQPCPGFFFYFFLFCGHEIHCEPIHIHSLVPLLTSYIPVQNDTSTLRLETSRTATISPARSTRIRCSTCLPPTLPPRARDSSCPRSRSS